MCPPRQVIASRHSCFVRGLSNWTADPDRLWALRLSTACLTSWLKPEDKVREHFCKHTCCSVLILVADPLSSAQATCRVLIWIYSGNPCACCKT